MKRERKEKHFIKKPVYEGGLTALRAFIKTNLKYPQTALEHQIEGTILVRYTINFQGKVIAAKIVKGIGYGCDEEAVRLVKLLKFKIGKTRKIKIQFHKSIQIHFKLPPKKTGTKIQYKITSKKEVEKKPKNSDYNYTITIN